MQYCIKVAVTVQCRCMSYINSTTRLTEILNLKLARWFYSLTEDDKPGLYGVIHFVWRSISYLI